MALVHRFEGEGDSLFLRSLRPNSLALRHHLAVHGAGATIATVTDAGQTTGCYPAISAAVEGMKLWSWGWQKIICHAGTVTGLGVAGEGHTVVTGQNVEAGPTHLQVTSPVCLLTTQAPWRQRLHLFTSHLDPSK